MLLRSIMQPAYVVAQKRSWVFRSCISGKVLLLRSGRAQALMHSVAPCTLGATSRPP